MKETTYTVSLTDQDAVKEILIDSVFSLWQVVNNLTRLRPSKFERYRVTIFGSARASPDSEAYEQVKQIAKGLAGLNCDINTGGGPGLMQAANEGASGVGHQGRSVGIRIDLPFEQEGNPFVRESFMHGTFFTRLHHFVIASDAFVIVPGGIGTTLEAMMVWQLLQVKHLKDIPLIFVGEMWDELIEWARKHMLSKQVKLANTEDLNIPICVKQAEDVLNIIRKDQAKWASFHK